MPNTPPMDANEEPVSIDLYSSEPLEHDVKRSLTAAVTHVLKRHGKTSARVSIAIVDDDTIRKLNQRYLQHDWSTDVLSFPLEQENEFLEGEIVASRETAGRAARQRGCRPDDELLLYVVHGALHLVGFDDKTAAAKRAMRRAERDVLRFLTHGASAAESRSTGVSAGPSLDKQGAHTR